MRTALFLALGVSVAALAACEAQLDTRGNLPDPEVVLQVQPGIDNRQQVAELLGSPSTMGTFDDKTWYYISKKTKRYGFLEPQVLDQEVLIVKFDDAGTVSDMKLLGIEDAHQVVPNPNETPTSGRELTVLQQLLGNVGRFGNMGGCGNIFGTPGHP